MSRRIWSCCLALTLAIGLLGAMGLRGRSLSFASAVTCDGDRPDFNGDGVFDLVVGSPGEDVGSAKDAGSVTILFGSRTGVFKPVGGLEVTEESLGQVPERGDRFGAAVLVRDVNNDLCLDLVIGVPGKDARRGEVVVVLGSPTGVLAGTPIVLRQGVDGAPGAAAPGNEFGAALAMGGDPGGSLLVGAPGERVSGRAGAGAVDRFPSVFPAGLNTTGSVEITQATPGIREPRSGATISVRRSGSVPAALK